MRPDYDLESIVGRVSIETSKSTYLERETGDGFYFVFKIKNPERDVRSVEPDKRDWLACVFQNENGQDIGWSLVDANDPYVLISETLVLQQRDIRVSPTLDFRKNEDIMKAHQNGILDLHQVNLTFGERNVRNFLMAVYGRYTKEEMRGIFLEAALHNKAAENRVDVKSLREILVSSGFMTSDYITTYRDAMRRSGSLNSAIMKIEQQNADFRDERKPVPPTLIH